MKGFRKDRSMYIAELDDVEKRILGGVFTDTALLLGVDLRGDDGAEADSTVDALAADFLRELTQEVGEPEDPALARLLPSASDDEKAAAEFRRLTEGDIRATKVARLRKWVRAFRAPGALLYVPVNEAGEWVAALTDVRLVLASRLGIETEDDAEAIHAAGQPRGDSREEQTQFALGQIYSALTWLQESLLETMMRGR